MNKRTCFNDGYVSIYKDPIKRGSFGAKTNIESVDDLDFVVKLAFKEASKREEDVQMLEMQGKTLSLKVKTPIFKGIQSNYKLVHNNILYDIVYIDTDRMKREMYIYCEEVKKW